MSEATPENPNRTGKPVVRLPRWKLCQYFLATDYSPFTIGHVKRITGTQLRHNAQTLVENLIKLDWARKTNAPANHRLTAKEAGEEWFELTPLGVQGILNSSLAKGKPRPMPGTLTPLYARTPSSMSHRRNTSVSSNLDAALRIDVFGSDLAVAPRAVTAPAATHLTVSTRAGDITIPAEAMRQVYDSLRAIFG